MKIHEFAHKTKPFVNKLLKATGLHDSFHTFVVNTFGKRERLSRKYIKGKGIEVGALHTPLKIFNNAEVTYIDRMDNKGLLKHYPELKKFKFVKVGLVDDGEKLSKVKTASVDFVIANHFIEHCEDPISTIKNHLRVLKNDGIAFWAIPDKRYTFDVIRKTTTLKHIIDDFEKGPKNSRAKHYDEWAEIILKLKNEVASKKARELEKELYSIHFHTYTLTSFKSLLNYMAKSLKINIQVVDIVPNINEFIVVVKKI